MLSDKAGRGWRLTGAALALGQAGHRLVGGERLFSFASLFFSLSLVSPPSFKKSIKLSLSPAIIFCIFTLPILPAIPLGRSGHVARWCLAAFWG